MTGSAENGIGRLGSRVRMAAWGVAALLLLLPLAAGAPWNVGDYVIAGALLFGSLGAYELAVRLSGNAAYRAGAGLAIAAVFLLTWVNGAVGVTDSDADGLFLVAVAIGTVGAFVARFRPAGMALAMFAAALATASVGVIALIAGVVPEFNSAFEVLGITGFFVVLFAGSGLLFREAAREGADGKAA